MKDLSKLTKDELMREFFIANKTYFKAMRGFVFTVPQTPEYQAAKEYLEYVAEEVAKRKKEGREQR